MTVLTGALLAILDEAGVAIMTMTEGIEAEELFASRITLDEVVRQLVVMVETTGNIPPDFRQKMPELDWSGWTFLREQRALSGGFEREALWFSVQSLIPATLMWLRTYRHNAPELFSIAP